MKRLHVWRPLGATLFAVLAVVAWRATYQTAGHQLTTSTKTYRLDLANTPELRAKGLGGRGSIPNSQGMLFVFDELATQCFWMKDMSFSLDIIWLDAQKKVVHIEKNVSPDTFPKSYCPNELAKYVVELNAGEAERNHLVVGQPLSF